MVLWRTFESFFYSANKVIKNVLYSKKTKNVLLKTFIHGMVLWGTKNGSSIESLAKVFDQINAASLSFWTVVCFSMSSPDG